MSLIDVVDILVVAFVMYKLYMMIRHTQAMSIFVGIGLLGVLWLVVRALNMELTGTILGQMMGAGFIALLIVFQQEVRRFLLYVGSQYKLHRMMAFRRIFSPHATIDQGQMVAHLVEAAVHMGQQRQGALIVLERKSALIDVEDSGTHLDASVQTRLLESIFFKNSPLHDGAVLTRGGRIVAAQCILPVSKSPHIPLRLGVRHRAAMGLTEHTDALVLVVSEETGAVSLVDAAEIAEDLSSDALRGQLLERLGG